MTIIKEKIYMRKALKYYGSYYLSYKEVIDELISYYNQKKELIAIWGAGLKGSAFLKVFDSENCKISCAYDISSDKDGTKMPTGHTICKPNNKKYKIGVVFLMNNNYEAEVACAMRENNIKASLVNIDSIILGKMPLKEVLEMYGEKI